MSRLDLASLQVGDVIESTTTLQVVLVNGEYVEAKDVQSGAHYGFIPSEVDGSTSTRKLTMVKRAVRKPKVGDVITGADVREIQWKRGTAIQSVRFSEDVYLLNRNGTWDCSTGTKDVDFKCFGDHFKCKVLHVA